MSNEVENGLSDVLNCLKCSAATTENKHICKEPVILTCGHLICNSCLRQNEQNTMKCRICDKDISVNLCQKQAPFWFATMLNQNLSGLFKLTFNHFTKASTMLKDLVNNRSERIHELIEFIKEEIEIRIESLKTELDEFYECFCKELIEIANDWKSRDEIDSEKNIYLKEHIKELEKIEINNKNLESLTKEDLYFYQNKITDVQRLIKKFQENTSILVFKESKENIKKSVIGELIYENNTIEDRKIVKRIKENSFKRMNVEYKPTDLCILPNGNLLLLNFWNKNIQLYNFDKQQLSKINKFNNKKLSSLTLGVVAATTDGVDRIYLCDFLNHFIIKTDFELNPIFVFGNGAGNGENQVNEPNSICYYNQCVYVCNRGNTRIQRLTSNLQSNGSLQLEYTPLSIKNINNIAMVRGRNQPSIYVYNLDNFNLIKNYDGHNGIIGASTSHFFEYFGGNQTLYYYDKSGELLEQFQTTSLLAHKTFGSIAVFNSKLFCVSDDDCFITVI